MFLILVIVVYFLSDLLINFKFEKNKFIPKPGSCLILQEKYCKQAKITIGTISSSSVTVAFNLPKNTPLFSPVDGVFSTGIISSKENEEQRYPSFSIKQKTDNLLLTYSLITHIDDDKKFNGLKDIKKGTAFFKINQEKDKSSDNYNLFVLMSYYDFDKKEYINSDNLLKKLFSIK